MAEAVEREVVAELEPARLPFAIPLELSVADRDVIAALSRFSEGPERDEYALSALKIGVLALQQAQGQLDAEAIQRESDRMLSSLEQKLGQHSLHLREHMASTLKEYFDPQSGRFQERVERLVGNDGDLERLLKQQLGGDDSQLAKTLVAHVGQESPLLKMLNPEESDGLLASVRSSLGEELSGQRRQILEQFSLDNKQGALARLVAELTENHGELNTNLQNKIDKVVKEFSLDSEDSALSRLVMNVTSAQKTITNEFSLDNDTSALARLRRELLGVLKGHSEDNQTFREEVKVALGKMSAKKEQMERSPQHGLIFEDAVYEFLAREAQHAGDIAEPTGMTTGMIKNCKVGDVVIELGPDSAAPGAKVVVEVKEEVGYTLAKAREEIDVSRRNRGAQMGLFVFSKKTAPAALGPFTHLGNDVFVVWDAEDSTSDIFLKAGLITDRALCIRAGRQGEAQKADFTSIDEAILDIEKKSEQLEEIETATSTIQKASEKILKRIGLTRKGLTKQVETLREKIGHVREITEAGDGEV